MTRWISVQVACGIWGGGICVRTMRRIVERWHDSGYAIGQVVRTPGGHWRVSDDLVRREAEKSRTNRTGDSPKV